MSACFAYEKAAAIRCIPLMDAGEEAVELAWEDAGKPQLPVELVFGTRSVCIKFDDGGLQRVQLPHHMPWDMRFKPGWIRVLLSQNSNIVTTIKVRSIWEPIQERADINPPPFLSDAL